MFDHIIVPLLIFISCTVLGFVIEKLIFPFISRLGGKNGVQPDHIIIRSLKGMILLWGMITGIYLALLYAFYNAPWKGNMTKAVVSLAILSVSLIVSRIVVGIVRNYSKKVEGVLPSTSMFSHLTKLIVFLIGALTLLQYLGISITPILTALGVGGLAVALALQSTLSNLFAGLQILLSRQLKIGDYIRLDSGEEGYITDISWRNTSLRMMSNSMVLIPNAKLSTAAVINHNLPSSEISVSLSVGISYSSDLDKVEKVALEVAKETLEEIPGAVKDFQPSFSYTAFSDYNINFSIVLRAETYSDQFKIKHEFIKRLHKRFQQEGIDIPFPVSTVHLAQ